MGHNYLSMPFTCLAKLPSKFLIVQVNTSHTLMSMQLLMRVVIVILLQVISLSKWNPGDISDATCRLMSSTEHVNFTTEYFIFFAANELALLLNLSPPSTYICVGELVQHWFTWWFFAYSEPSHYLNQCWVIVNWAPRNTPQWHLIKIQNISFTKLHVIISSAKWRPFFPGGGGMSSGDGSLSERPRNSYFLLFICCLD